METLGARATACFEVLAIMLVVGPGQTLFADPVVHLAKPITHQVNVAIIQVADDSGNNAAPLWGSSAQTATVFERVDMIWAQAGIDVQFISFRSSTLGSTYGTYNNSFALTGTVDPRPESDLETIVSNAGSTILHPDPNTLNLFVTRVVPGSSQDTDNGSRGLAFVNANGITLWNGPTLTTFDAGLDALAFVLAHEIGHNLGLDHDLAMDNLMRASGGGNSALLNDLQIGTALASPFSVVVAVPEASSLLAVGLVACLVGAWQLKATAPHGDKL